MSHGREMSQDARCRWAQGVLLRRDSPDSFDVPTNDELAEALETLEHYDREVKRKRAFEELSQKSDTTDIFSWPPTLVELDTVNGLTPMKKRKIKRSPWIQPWKPLACSEVQAPTGWLPKLRDQ